MYSQHGNKAPSVLITDDLKGALQNVLGVSGMPIFN